MVAVAFDEQLLPDRLAVWPELEPGLDGAGFRTKQACEGAAAMWPGADHQRGLERVAPPGKRPADRDPWQVERTYWRIAGRKGTRAAIAWWQTRQPELRAPDPAADNLDHHRQVVSRRAATLQIGPGLLTVKWRTADAPNDPCEYGCRCCRHVESCECDVCRQDEADAERCALLLAADEGAVSAVVSEFSTRARGRMMRFVASVDWAGARRPGERLLMITLTYPRRWRQACPNPQTAQDHLGTLSKRFQRATGTPLRCVWVREFQRRGAPHFHLLAFWPDHIGGRRSKQWLSEVWYQIVGSNDTRHLRAGTRIDIDNSFRGVMDPKRIAAYFAGYTATGTNKDYQYQPPPGWRNDTGSVGGYWGRRNLEPATAEVAITPAEVIELKRIVRRMIRAQKRTAPRRVPRQVPVRYANTITGETIGVDQWRALDEPEQRRWHRVTGDQKRWRTVNRRWRLRSLTPNGPAVDGERGFTVFANDAPLLAIQIARQLHGEEEPWPKGQTRPLP